MSVEELTTHIEELKKTNQDLQDKLKIALDTVEVYTKDEIDGLIAAITEATELTEEEVREEISEAGPAEAVDQLKKMKALVDNVKVDYKPVRAGAGADTGPETGLTVGRWSAAEKKWVS